MRRTTILLLLALGPALGACANEDDEEQRDPAVQGDSLRVEALSDRQIAALLRFVDGTEIATARQLLPKLATAPARDYAQVLIDDHTRLRRLAQRTELDDSSAAPPQFRTLRAVTSTQSAMFMTLPSGRSFDATFLGVQAANHALVVDSLRKWRNEARDEGLRATIDAALPVVQSHRERALAAFNAVQGADTTPARPPVVRVDSAGPQHVHPDSTRLIRD